MPSFEVHPEVMLLRSTVISVVLQALIARLLGSGVLDDQDLISMRGIALQFAADLVSADLADRDNNSATVDRKSLEDEIKTWWDTVATMGGCDTNF